MKWALIFLMSVISFFAILAGLSMIIDTTGAGLQFPPSTLDNTPFDSYLIPGIILFLLLGIYPLFIIYSLIRRVKWSFLNIYKEYWGWTHTIYFSIIVIVWILVQSSMIPYFYLQTIVGLIGVVILIVAMLPRVRKKYSK